MAERKNPRKDGDLVLIEEVLLSYGVVTPAQVQQKRQTRGSNNGR